MAQYSVLLSFSHYSRDTAVIALEKEAQNLRELATEAGISSSSYERWTIASNELRDAAQAIRQASTLLDKTWRVDYLVKRIWPDEPLKKARIKALRFLTPKLGLWEAKAWIEEHFLENGHGESKSHFQAANPWLQREKE